MKTRLAAGMAFFCLLSCAGSAFALPGAWTLETDSPVYGAVKALYLEQGLAAPESPRPWTLAELRTILGRIDADGLSPAGRRAYAFIRAQMDPEPVFDDGTFAFHSGARMSPEGFTRIELGQDGGRSPEDYSWLHGWEDRSAFLDIPMAFCFGDALAARMDMSVKEEHNTVESGLMADGLTFPSGVTTNSSNLVFDDPNPRIDLHFPYRAFMGAAGPWWSLRFGRDRLSWGNGGTGNLMLSDWSDFYDFVGYSLWSSSAKLSGVYIAMDRFPLGGADSMDRDSGTYGFVGHRLDLRLGRRWLLSLSESVVLGGSLDADPLRDLNTMMVFHNWTDPERMNSLLTLELSVNPWRYVNVYAQGAMDELTTSYEASGDGGGGPGVFGFLGGAEFALPLDEGYLTGRLEGAWTSPWLYNRRKEPYYYNVRRYWSLTTDRFEFVAKPIGYRYGPDSAIGDLLVEYRIPGSWSASGELLFRAQGETEMGTAWAPAPGDIAPSGVPEYLTALRLGGAWAAFSWLELGGECNLIWLRNREHIAGTWNNDLELSAWASIQLPRIANKRKNKVTTEAITDPEVP